MRKFILIAAMVLASATAQAGQSRGLTLAANDDQPAAAATDQAKDQGKDQVKDTATPVETPKAAETPKFVDRPAAVDRTTTTAQPPKADADKPVTTAKADKLRRKNHWTEARIIGELHRHGIYW
jgi:hypothetical protein